MNDIDKSKEALLLELQELRNENNELKITYQKDIAEHKKIEAFLRESELNFRTLTENSRDGILIVGPSGFHCYANHRASEITGYSIDELLSKTRFDLTHPDEIPKVKERISQMYAGNKIPNLFKTKIISKSGITIPIEVTSGQTIWRGQLSSFTHIRDITERELMEESLRESESHFRLLTEGVADVVWKQDANNCFTYISPADEKLRGYKSEEWIGRHIFELLTEEGKNSIIDKMKQRHIDEIHGIKTGSLTFEVQQICKDGSLIWTEIISTAEHDDQGKIIGFHGVSRNISERKKTEQLIKQQNEELLKINSEKDKFFSIIAHDLRSPFNAFLGLTKMMSENINNFSYQEMNEISKDMHVLADNLYKLLENLLEWSRMQRGLTEFNPETCYLSYIVKQNIEIAKESVKQKGIEFIKNVPEDLQIIVDIPMLNSVCRNLISNSIKFTHRGGKIEIGSKAKSSEDFITIYIKDNGIGMDDEMINKLFRIDEKVSRLGTENEPSTGLGLLLCKEFIEKHGGKIWVESKVGKGSTFYFTVKYSV